MGCGHMLVVPVIDLQAGRAVHGRGGCRAAYLPVRSVLTDRPDPVALARGVIGQLGLRQIYLAGGFGRLGHTGTAPSQSDPRATCSAPTRSTA